MEATKNGIKTNNYVFVKIGFIGKKIINASNVIMEEYGILKQKGAIVIKFNALHVEKTK